MEKGRRFVGQGSKQQRESVKDNKREAGEKLKRSFINTKVYGCWGSDWKSLVGGGTLDLRVLGCPPGPLGVGQMPSLPFPRLKALRDN